jgi:hypothetical protein
VVEQARDLDALAAKLGRPPTALSGFQQLTPGQIGLLIDLIERARSRYGEELDAQLTRAISPPLRTGLRLLAGRRGR